jgi:hypothetical protein
MTYRALRYMLRVGKKEVAALLSNKEAMHDYAIAS